MAIFEGNIEEQARILCKSHMKKEIPDHVPKEDAEDEDNDEDMDEDKDKSAAKEDNEAADVEMEGKENSEAIVKEEHVNGNCNGEAKSESKSEDKGSVIADAVMKERNENEAPKLKEEATKPVLVKTTDKESSESGPAAACDASTLKKTA